MKKLIAVLLIILLSISIIGCSQPKGLTDIERQKLEERKKELKEAENLIKNHMELIMQENFKEAYKHVKLNPSKKSANIKDNIESIGYKIESVEKIGTDLVATVNVFLCQIGKPYYSVENMRYSMSRDEETKKMMIEGVEDTGGLSFFEEEVKGEKAFLVREGRVTKSEPIFRAVDLPTYIIFKTNAHPQSKVPVGKDEFGPVSISNDGKQMVIASVESGNTLLIMVEKALSVFNNNLTAQGTPGGGASGGGSGGASGGGTSGGGGGDAGKALRGAETPNIQTLGVDYFEKSTVEYVSFSPSGDVIYVQVRSGDKVTLNIYSAHTKEILAPRIMEKFNSPEYTITRAYYNNDDSLVLQVKNIKDNKLENYILNLREDKIIKQDE